MNYRTDDEVYEDEVDEETKLRHKIDEVKLSTINAYLLKKRLICVEECTKCTFISGTRSYNEIWSCNSSKVILVLNHQMNACIDL